MVIFEAEPKISKKTKISRCPKFRR